ncbi:MAG: 5-carboxymethyl-2-hydroxymuconate Delta-isomerase [Deltaproteobacteria bacterium]|jgi:5-carboxymethyl-2-hydroxymuconate isomerase|nr:5-carboxymethyl-2-hydroxymuconate Delta-isomerase [Deltaproteobacteria bacterium]
MPHFILEYSDNLLEKMDHRRLFQDLHRLLVENGPFRLSDIKSRAVAHRDFYISDGDDANAFIHLTLSIFKGRAPDIQHRVGNKLLAFLENEFARSCAGLKCSITVEIKEINTDTYFKISNL